MSLAAAPSFPDIGRLAHAGVPTFVWTQNHADYGASATLMGQPGLGNVGVITEFHFPAQQSRDTSPAPLDFMAGLQLLAPDGTTFDLPFFIFNRTWEWGTPALRSHFDQPCVWKLRHPFIVPGGWALRYGNPASDMRTGVAAYGYLLEENEARNFGFDVSTTVSQASRRWIQTGAAVGSGNTTLIAARTGMCIQILELLVRLQPDEANQCAVTLQELTSGNKIFTFRNDNRINPCEWQVSPGIYLSEGEALRMVGSAVAQNRGSVMVIARYVDVEDVPPNHWWAYREPAFASPDSTTVGTIGKRAGTILSCYYPRSETTKTTPGVGLRHVVEGYAISASKDSDLLISQDYVIAALTTGAAVGNIGVEDLSLTQANQLISPIFSLAGHQQGFNLSVSNQKIVCPADTGAIIFQPLALNGALNATPAEADNNIDGWNTTVWGRTVDETVRGLTQVR